MSGPYALEVRLVAASPLHIGAAGRAYTQAHRGILKDARGWPYVPATAFKGRLRHTVEALAQAAGLTVCDPHYPRCRNPEQACLTCRLFGSPWVPGRLMFQDFPLSGPEDVRQRRETSSDWPATTFRHGVALSRSRRAAQPGLLYIGELFLPGVPLTFSGRIEGIPTPEDAAWLWLGLRFLNTLGGDRSRGLGWVSIEALLRDAQGNPVPPEALPTPWEAAP